MTQMSRLNKVAWVRYVFRVLVECHSPFPDTQHQIYYITLGKKLSAAPLDPQIKSVLDLGCGTGIWAIDVANQFPSVKVVAMDLTPPNVPAPSNVTFVQADIEPPWQLGLFDYIHCRMLMSAVGDWPGFLQKCWDHLEPGAWLELNEVCAPYRAVNPQFDASSSAFLRFGAANDQAWNLAGRDFFAGPKQTQRLRDIGFQEIDEVDYRLPIGSWGITDRERRIGGLVLEACKKYVSSSAQLLAQIPDLDERESKQLIQEAVRDVEENGVRNEYYFDL